MGIELSRFVQDFAAGVMHADSRRPQATNVRSKISFQPGIGPHAEARTVQLVCEELSVMDPEIYGGQLEVGVPYPDSPRLKCDLSLGLRGRREWAIEVKMLRLLGDNGKANDNILMHILSPYPAHRSALTDCEKLVGSSLARRRAVLIFGYDAEQWPLEPAILAFEALARERVRLGPRAAASFRDLVHPVHKNGSVFAWEVGRLGGDG